MRKNFLNLVWTAFIGLVAAWPTRAQTILEADGSTDTYTLINSVLGGAAEETPDCSDPAFGPHITQRWDAQLAKYVFSFFIHVTPDDDRCLVFDRQRNEIKTYAASPNYLKGFYGDTCNFKWKFKLDAGFQPSPNFTHIHQIKAGDGNDADNPIITITPRYYSSKPEELQVIFVAPTAAGGSQTNLMTADLSDFKGQWVEASERLLYATNGTYELVLKRVSDGFVLLSCTNNNLNLWRGDATFNRPKWGIYRSTTNVTSYLRDEEVRFADFCLGKGADMCPSDTLPSIIQSPLSVAISSGANVNLSVTATGTDPLSYQWRQVGVGWGGGNDWRLTNGAGSFTVGDSTSNGTAGTGLGYGINTGGNAWGLTHNGASGSAPMGAYRNFSPLQIGETFQIDMDSGTTSTSSTRTNGIALRNASNNTVWEFKSTQGGNYTINGAATGIPYTSRGLRISMTLTSATNYSAMIQDVNTGTNYNGSTPFTGTLLNPSGGPTITRLFLYVYRAGVAPSATLFFNNIKIGYRLWDDASAYTTVNWTNGSNLGHIGLADGGNLSGSTSNTLTFSPVTTNNAGNYDVVVANRLGSVSSPVATLAVTAAYPPVITNQPANLSVVISNSAAFNVGVSGDRPLAYQWRFNDAAIVNANSNFYTLTNVVVANAGGYSVVVTNTSGAVTSVVATLTVNIPPTITSPPASQTVWFGDTAMFSVGASGNQPLNFQWFLNATNPIGSNTNVLTIAPALAANAGNYSVVVSNAFGVVTSSIATLAVTTSGTNIFDGTGTWTCPAYVTSVRVECWGAGGAGGSAWRDPDSNSVQYGGGGAGGAYARINSYPVTPGNTYYVSIGTNSINNSTNNDTRVDGGDSWFNSINSPSAVIIAKGGQGGESAVGNTTTTRYGLGGIGTTNGSAGDVVFAGGNGATGASSLAGGGGSSAGTDSVGNSATNNLGAIAPAGGGDGGTGPTASSAGGGAGSAPGGGGSGARASGIPQAGGIGGAGRVILTYNAGISSPTNVSATAVAPTGNGSGPGGLTTYPERTRIILTEIPSAGTAPFAYAWKKVGADTVLGTNSTLVVSSPVDGDQYLCQVAATWDGVISTSPPATLTVTTTHDPSKVVIIKADDFRVPNQAWTNFLQVSRNLGIKVSLGVIVSNIIGNAATAQWMQSQQAMGDVEFWNHGWNHTYWTNSGTTVYEFEGSGLAYQQTHLADAQAGLSNTLGKAVLAFGAPYNQMDTDTAAIINTMPALRMVFVSSVNTAQSIGLDDRVAAVKIIGEFDGTGMPNAAAFIAAYPGGPAGPVALQFHPANSSFDADRLAEYQQIVQYLLTNGYAIVLPSEYVASLPVAASFSAAPMSGGAPLLVTFTDTSLGSPTNRFWSFGDGATTNTTATSLLHTYSFPGTNAVRLIVRDASGGSTNIQSNLIVVTSVDTVGDGIPDWWRAQYFGGNGTTTNASSNAAADLDHDGLNNLAEYQADTNPTNPASRFALGDLSIITNDVLLVWFGGSNAWQYVECSSDLNRANSWSSIFTNAPPTPITNLLLHKGAVNATNRFYRVKAWR